MSLQTSRRVGLLFVGAAMSAVSFVAFWFLDAEALWSKAKTAVPLSFAAFLIFGCWGVYLILKENERLRESIANADRWDDREERFSVMNFGVTACWRHPVGDEPAREWWFTGTVAENEDFLSKARSAGAILRHSRYMIKNHSLLLREPDNLALWCSAIMKLVNYTERVRNETIDGGVTYLGGSIEQFAEASKLLCAKLAAEERALTHAA